MLSVMKPAKASYPTSLLEYILTRITLITYMPQCLLHQSWRWSLFSGSQQLLNSTVEW